MVVRWGVACFCSDRGGGGGGSGGGVVLVMVGSWWFVLRNNGLSVFLDVIAKVVDTVHLTSNCNS